MVSALKMEATCPSDMLVNINTSTGRAGAHDHIPHLRVTYLRLFGACNIKAPQQRIQAERTDRAERLTSRIFSLTCFGVTRENGSC